MKRLGWTLLIGVWASAAVSVAPASTADHKATLFNADRIERTLKSAVLPIYLGKAYNGTGFVVAADSGFLLTAAHVVDKTGPNAPISILAPTETEPLRRLPASIVASLADYDLALIQVTPTDALKGLRSIGVSFAPFARSEQYFAVGYPADQENEPVWRIDPAIYSGKYKNLISVTQPVEGGNSGSPLFDTWGCARAVCIQLRGAGLMTASYVPIEEAQPLLDKLPLSGEMLEIDRKMRAHTIPDGALDDLLTGDPPHPSNTELYAWGRNIITHASDYRRLGSVLYHVVFPAFNDRGLPQLVWQIAGVLGPLQVVTKGPEATGGVDAEVSRARGQMAEAEFAAGHVLQAAQFANEALALALKGKNRQNELNIRILLGRVQLDAGNIGEARAQADFVLKRPDLPEAMKARAFALSGSVADKAGDFKQATEAYNQAVRLYSAASDDWQAAEVRSAIANLKQRSGVLGGGEEELAQAAKDYRKAGDVPKASEALYQLAQIQIANGNREGLAQTLKSYLSVEPEGAHAAEVGKVLTHLAPANSNLNIPLDRIPQEPQLPSPDSPK